MPPDATQTFSQVLCKLSPLYCKKTVGHVTKKPMVTLSTCMPIIFAVK